VSSWPFAAAALCLLVAAAFVNALSGEFVLDARVLVLDDPRLRAVTVGNLHEILTRSYWWPYTTADDLYRPVTTLSYLVNYAVLGHADRPAGYHLLNVVLHAANVLLLYGLLRRLSSAAWPALIAAAIWAVHPLVTEAVTNIAGRADLLAATGVLAGLLLYVRAADRSGAARIGRLVAAAVAVGVGAFSKESAVAVLPIVVAYDLLIRRPRPGFSTLIAGWGVVAVPVAALLYQRSVVLQASTGASTLFVDNPLVSASGSGAVLTALSVLGRYVWLAFWPARLSADYSFAAVPLASGSATDWAAWITVAAAVAATIALGRVNRLAAFAAAAGWLAILPVSNLIVTTGTIMAERLTYVPLAALASVVVGGLFAALASCKPHGFRLAIGVSSLLIVALGWRTVTRNADWRDELTLWTATSEAVPGSFKAHAGLADAIYRSDPGRERLDQVVAAIDRSVTILEQAPPEGRPWKTYRQAAVYALEYGDQLRARGPVTAVTAEPFKKAEAYSREHIRAVASTAIGERASLLSGDQVRELADAHGLLASALLRLGRLDEAVGAATDARRLQPGNPVTHRVLAGALSEANRPGDAATALLTGFLITGDATLRDTAIGLYRGGLDTRGCAISDSPTGPTLNPTCPMVAEHLCAAAREASELQRSRGRADLASGIDQMAAQRFGCAQTPDPLTPGRPPGR
jgi:hypothetical protein